jgi:hypothetical protein
MRAFSAVTFATVVCGCFGPASHVDSNATLTVTGVVQRESGAGDGSAKVQLIRHPDALQAVGDAITIIGTVGLACIAGNDSLCHPYAQATAAADGRYTFGAIRGADTQGSLGEALLYSAWVSGPPPHAPATGPAGVGADFYIQKAEVAIPPLRLWETPGSEDDASGSPSFSWPALESSVGSVADDYRLNIATGKGDTIWSTTTSGSSRQVSIDPRVTQDFSGNWAVRAHRKIAGDDTDFDLTWYSPSAAYASRGRIPLSRGKDCWLQGADGPVKQSPCPLTDGDLATRLQTLPTPQCPAGQPCTPPQQNNWVYVDLGTATTVSALVLYDVALGSSLTAFVEGSLDATSWTPLATPISTHQYQLVTLSGSPRYVRLRLADATSQFPGSGNSEVAIF